MPFLSLAALGAWLYLIFGHGRFWRSLPELSAAPLEISPDVEIIVPARDEEHTIAAVIASLGAQEYGGRYGVLLVDDASTDATTLAAGSAPRLRILRLTEKPPGWSGKLYALERGVLATRAPLLLFTDADIVHHPRHLQTLVSHLQRHSLDMVSEMVQLNCTSTAEKIMVPAFVFFFQMLYPFSRVNSRDSRVAAAAGGTILIRRAALERSGGIAAIKHALIDDVSLAKSIKRGGPIYLGHTRLATSIRPYPGIGAIWDMIARTAFTQLRYSGTILLLTLLGMALIWLLPLGCLLFGTGITRWAGAVACALAAGSYMPTLRRYHRNPAGAALLPLIALFYLGATCGSAVNHWRGKGTQWKARAYGARGGRA